MDTGSINPSKLLEAYQAMQQQQVSLPNIQCSPNLYQGITSGLLGSSGAIGTAMGWYDNSSTASTPPVAYQSVPSYDYQFPHVTDRIIRFFRINKLVEMYETAKVEEPLDELRVKVATWLNN